MVGHRNKDVTINTAKYTGLKLNSGNIEPCVSFSAINFNQNNVPKKREQTSASKKGVRIYIDIATLKKPNDLDVNFIKPQWKF